MRQLLIASMLGGCVAGIGDDGSPLSYDQVEAEVASANKLAANKLAANKLAANKLAASSLGGSSLDGSTLIDTDDGREVLSYIVDCALPAGSTLVVRSGKGKKYTFAGELGLAPAWALGSPSVGERRWVSACVLARTNLYGVSVQLSLRGAHPALATSGTETRDYMLFEGAFYGDLFAPDGPHEYACVTEIQDLELALSTEELRACAMSDDGKLTRCGFTYTGKCGRIDLTADPACQSFGPPYAGCRTDNACHTGDVGATYAEVITVALATPTF